MEVLLYNACAAIATLMKGKIRSNSIFRKKKNDKDKLFFLGLTLEETSENLRIRDKPQDEPSEKKIALEEKKD